MSPPLVLVCASVADAADYVIKGILKDAPTTLVDNGAEAPGTRWTIDNKYYHADVCLHALTDAQSAEHIDLDSVEAVIIYIQNYKGESLATADKRKQVLAGHSCEVNILLCDKCDESFPREQATVWCLERDYQLIELHEEPEPVDDSCPIEDCYGMDRVIDTLHTHTWSNHEMKDRCIVNNHLEDLAENGASGEDDLEYMDQFCKLFAQMSSVTQNAASMPSEGRKAYAEQVVKAFWKAIGGDESELDDTVNT